MAELSEERTDWTTTPWTQAQARGQLAAIAWLRWRIFLNSFRYRSKKRGVAGLVALVLLRILAWGVIGTFLAGPVGACGYFGYAAIAEHEPGYLTVVLWTVFTVNLFISINVSPATLGFDLRPLLRFPLSLGQYLLIRLFFGLFSIPNVVATLCLFATAVGIGIADNALFPWAALVLGLFALHNVLFLRMIFAWVDRWLGTKRAREIFGGIVLVMSLGFQLAFTGGSRHRFSRYGAILHLVLGPLHPVAQYLPPSLAADAIVDQWRHSFAPALASVLGIVAFALAFLAIFAMRLNREFRGENLSEGTVRLPRPAPRAAVAPVPLPESSASRLQPASGLHLPPTIAACLEKELIYLRRSGAQLYGLITPIFFVFVITRSNRTLSHSAMILPYAVSYVMFGLLAGLYNVLGADGRGYNLYLLAPVRLRDVFVAKNLVNATIIGIEIAMATLAATLINRTVPSAAMISATLLWAAFALLTNLTIGNLRSLLAPMYFELGKVRRAPAAKGGALISLGVIAATLGTGIPTIFACQHFGVLWLATPIFIVLAGAALAAYLIVLSRLDGIATKHREDLVEALCKTS